MHESPAEPVTALGFREPTDETPATYLFIATTNRVLVYQASGRGSGGAASEVHEAGAALGCAVMDWKAHDIVVARDEAIYICGAESRGSSYAYEGEHLTLSSRYVLYANTTFRPEDFRAHPSELSCHRIVAAYRERDICFGDHKEFCREKRRREWH